MRKSKGKKSYTVKDGDYRGPEFWCRCNLFIIPGLDHSLVKGEWVRTG